GCSSHGIHEKGFDGLEKQHLMKGKIVKREKMDRSEMIQHYFRQPCDQVKEMRRDNFEWWRRS
ncbi:hypothetical protein Tco_0550058, partial [Tanacetum coccineum]